MFCQDAHSDADNADCATSSTIFSPILFKAFLQVFKLLRPAFRSLSDEHDTQVFTAKKEKTNETDDLLWSNLSLRLPSSMPAHTNMAQVRLDVLQQVFSSPALV